MLPCGLRIFPLLAFILMIPMTVAAKQTLKSIKEGACTEKGAHVVFRDGTQMEFPAKKGYKCSDFKVSAGHSYAGWQLSGTLIAETDGQKETYPDATVFVLVKGQSYPVTENSRYINDWYFVPGHDEVVAETAFEHGPSTYVLYDLELRKRTETCGQFELERCPRLQSLVKAKLSAR